MNGMAVGAQVQTTTLEALKARRYAMGSKQTPRHNDSLRACAAVALPQVCDNECETPDGSLSRQSIVPGAAS